MFRMYLCVEGSLFCKKERECVYFLFIHTGGFHVRRYRAHPDVTCCALSRLVALWRAMSRLAGACRDRSDSIRHHRPVLLRSRGASDQDQVYYPHMLKRFSEWFGLKKKLHESQQTPPLVSERDIWWASVGENVGSEINGKSALFSRPVIIYKKLSHGFYFVIPTTTQKKEGSCVRAGAIALEETNVAGGIVLVTLGTIINHAAVA